MPHVACHLDTVSGDSSISAYSQCELVELFSYIHDTYLLHLPIEVEVVSVPDRTAHLSLDPPQIVILPTGLVPQTVVQSEGSSVHQLEDCQLRRELQSVRLHSTSHCHLAYNNLS